MWSPISSPISRPNWPAWEVATRRIDRNDNSRHLRQFARRSRPSITARVQRADRARLPRQAAGGGGRGLEFHFCRQFLEREGKRKELRSGFLALGHHGFVMQSPLVLLGDGKY
jgi:hypothetical protein